MRIKNENKEFGTSDFYVAVFLCSSDFKLTRINKSDPRRFNFIFADKAERVKLLDEFFAGRALTEPRRFVAAIKELKQFMYSDAIQQ